MLSKDLRKREDMSDDFELLEQLHTLFYPQSIALIGVPSGMKIGKVFLTALLDMDFEGDIYPVNPYTPEVDGLKSYPNISSIPGAVDLAIVLVPHHSVLSVLRECVAKGVKGAVLFTGGFGESGTNEGQALEKELLDVARTSGMRILGPNCMGICSTDSRLSFFPGFPKEPGPVGIISQSGSLTILLGQLAHQKGIRFSKLVSVGNECDLNSADILTYLIQDPNTRIIGAYLEGIKDGPRFVHCLREAAHKKPVILWKVGATAEGSRAAASHTGSLACSSEVWNGIVQQSGAIPVVGLDDWVDMLVGFSFLPPPLGDRMAIVVGQDGLALAATDACRYSGLRLAEISPGTRVSLSKLISSKAASITNPIDLNVTVPQDASTIMGAIRMVAAEPGVDALLLVGMRLESEEGLLLTRSLAEFSNNSNKPILIVSTISFNQNIIQNLNQANIPFFDSPERAMGTYAKVRYYWRQRTSESIPY
jgi:acetyltransferase